MHDAGRAKDPTEAARQRLESMYWGRGAQMLTRAHELALSAAVVCPLPHDSTAMSNKPKRRCRSALATTPTSRGTFWGTIASYATEIAPVAGPSIALSARAGAWRRRRRPDTGDRTNAVTPSAGG